VKNDLNIDARREEYQTSGGAGPHLSVICTILLIKVEMQGAERYTKRYAQVASEHLRMKSSSLDTRIFAIKSAKVHWHFSVFCRMVQDQCGTVSLN
jgi:hypothetical protein